MTRPAFQVALAEDLARAFAKEQVDDLFLGNGGAILPGYPGTTQDVQVLARRSDENGRRLFAALRNLGFDVEDKLAQEIIQGRDFVQIKSGPFDVDILFAPDGIPSFDAAQARSVRNGIYPVANLRDIIARKRASGRTKDMNELPLLESFREECGKRHAPPLLSAAQIASERPREK